ncbi:MAG: phage holin family protein, partial [Bacilli bacterium]|nr:phage holin family protein [Bacilli bacterium]
MKKETKLLIKRILIGSMALLLFFIVVMSSLHYAFQNSIKVWVFFLISGLAILVFVGVMIFIEV